MRVYWGKEQPIAYEDADPYSPPTEWPKDNELIYRPIAIRIMGIGLEESNVEYFLDTYEVRFFMESEPGTLRGSANLVTILNFEELDIEEEPSASLTFVFGSEFAAGFPLDYGPGEGFPNSPDPEFFENVFLDYIDYINDNGGNFHPQEGSFTFIVVSVHHYKVVNGERIEI